MPDGRIEPRQVETLQEMGAWLKKYGESIYGTRGGPFKPGVWGASTHKGNTVFVHVLRQRGDTVSLPNIPRKIVRSSVLNGGKVNVDQSGDQITLRLQPVVALPNRGAELLVSTRTTPPGPEVIDTIVKLELDGSAMDLAPIEAPSTIKASASNVFKNDERYRALNAFDDDTATRWATDGGTKQAWVAADLGKPLTIERVRIVGGRHRRACAEVRVSISRRPGVEVHFHRTEDRSLVSAGVQAGHGAGIPVEHPRGDQWADHHFDRTISRDAGELPVPLDHDGGPAERPGRSRRQHPHAQARRARSSSGAASVCGAARPICCATSNGRSSKSRRSTRPIPT